MSRPTTWHASARTRGSHDIAQSYLLRPLPGQPAYRTVVPNVYMLGAAIWPGHGINGGSGYTVAQELLGR